MLRLLKLLAVSAVLTALFASAAMAQTVVKDQENAFPAIDANVINSGTAQAQSVTTATGGILTRGVFHLERSSTDVNSPLCADLWTSTGGGPRELQQTLGCLDPEAIPLAPDDNWVEMDFDASPYMAPGTSYAIALHTESNASYSWESSQGGTPGVNGDCTRDDYVGGISTFSSAGLGDGIYPNSDWRGASGSHCQDKLFQTYMTVDTTAPTGTVLINNGATRTTTRLVTLNLSATDPEPSSGVAEMRFKNEGADAVWSAWKPYAETKNWYLSEGEGTKRVAVQFRDAAGNRSATDYDYITYKR